MATTTVMFGLVFPLVLSFCLTTRSVFIKVLALVNFCTSSEHIYWYPRHVCLLKPLIFF